MKEIVINDYYGGFGLSHEAVLHYAKIKRLNLYWFYDNTNSNLKHYYILPENKTPKDFGINYIGMKSNDTIDFHKILKDFYFNENYDIPRDDIILIQIIKEMGKNANDNSSQLKIVKIPEDVEWIIEEYDGMETVKEVHKSWR